MCFSGSDVAHNALSGCHSKLADDSTATLVALLLSQSLRKLLATGQCSFADLEGATPAGKVKVKGKAAAAGRMGAAASSSADAENWKRQSEDLRSAMKASREISRRCAACGQCL